MLKIQKHWTKMWNEKSMRNESKTTETNKRKQEENGRTEEIIKHQKGNMLYKTCSVLLRSKHGPANSIYSVRNSVPFQFKIPPHSTRVRNLQRTVLQQWHDLSKWHDPRPSDGNPLKVTKPSPKAGVGGRIPQRGRTSYTQDSISQMQYLASIAPFITCLYAVLHFKSSFTFRCIKEVNCIITRAKVATN